MFCLFAMAGMQNAGIGAGTDFHFRALLNVYQWLQNLNCEGGFLSSA
jgi:hypothetical protein